MVSPLGCKEFALFKSVEQINRFKKHHFLNRFEQNNRFKKCTQGASPKNSTLQGASQKKKNYRGEKQNTPTLQGGINLFTLIYIKVEIRTPIILFVYRKISNY